MMSLDEAVQRLLEGARGHAPAARETVSTFDALHRVLADDVRSGLNVPPEDNSEMDGYALRVADVPAAGTVLPVSQRVPAGAVGQPLAPGTAARIFTGAQVPSGADAVVMQELCEPVPPARDGATGGVRVNTVPEAGMAIRRRGEDVQRGAVVLRAGTRLTPQAMGMAASVGAGTLAVWRRPRVALFSTGDELAMPGEPLKPGAIYNSNRFTLRGLLQAAGCEAIDLGIVPDRLDATRDALRRAAAQADLVLTCGGVSVGEEDHLKPALQAEGRLDLWQIAIKPGKPLAFGAVRRAAGGETLYVGCRQPGVEHRHLLAGGDAGAARALGHRARRPARGADESWLRLAAAQQAPRVPARARGRRRHARAVSQPGLGRADLDGVGRRPGRQPRLAGDRARRYGALPAVAGPAAMRPGMRIRVRYFASLREALGSAEAVEVAAGATLGALRDQLVARGGEHGRMLARGRAVRCALNQVMADDAVVLHDGAEVAFFPPVTGG